MKIMYIGGCDPLAAAFFERMNKEGEELYSSSEFERQCDLGEGFVSRINEKVRKQSGNEDFFA